MRAPGPGNHQETTMTYLPADGYFFNTEPGHALAKPEVFYATHANSYGHVYCRSLCTTVIPRPNPLRWALDHDRRRAGDDAGQPVVGAGRARVERDLPGAGLRQRPAPRTPARHHAHGH